MDYDKSSQKQTEYYENIYGNTLKLQIINLETNLLQFKIKNSKIELFPKKLCILAVCAIITTSLCAPWHSFINVSFLISIVLLFMYNIIFTVRQECLLVIKSLGYQIETKYMLGKSVQFIPWDSVDYVFINEVISMHRVLFVLTMFTKQYKNKQTLIPLFMATKPRLKCLETIYQELKKL